MDKKLLDSLSNLSLALEDIAAALKDKSEAQSGTAKALKGGDFIKEIKEINVGVKALQKDTKQILANQQTIMSMGKSKSAKKENVAENLGKDKTAQKNFKEGLGVILLIAVAVLAIGVAFNLVGKVNFFAVIALAIALPLLAIGFSKVHKILKEVGFDPKKDARNFIIAITAISVGITAASWILSMITPLSFSKFFTATFIALTFAMLGPSIYKFLMAFKEMSWGQLIKSVAGFALILPAIALGIAFASWAFQLIKPIGFSQFLTAVGIGIVFAIISFGIRKLLKSFKGIGVKDLMEAVIFLPLILPAIALGIAGASYAFQLIKPIGFVQFLTAVGIAIVFAVIAFGIRKLLKSFEGLSFGEVVDYSVMLPILLVAISYAIAYSSIALGKIKPISFSQFLTAVGVAAVFVVISFGIKQIVSGISSMKWTDVPKIPVFMILVAIAISVSSHILSMAKVIPAAKLLNLALFGIALAVVAAAIGGVMALFNKLKVGIKDALIGTLLIVVVAIAIMLSSHILAAGDYGNYPAASWTLGVALSMIAFIPAILVLGLIAMSGVGALVVLAGAGMVLVIAGTIMATSHILAMGKYSKFPSLEWSASVALSMAAFTVGMVLLGALIVGTFGLGGLMLAAGSEAVLMIAQTMVDASYILAKGKYVGGPTKDWAEGIAIALGAFSPVYSMMMANSLLSLFGGSGVGPEEFTTAIVTVSQGIVDAAWFFANNNSAFVKGPSKEWADGIGTAIGAFAPVYQVLADNSGWMSSGVSVEDMAKAIMTISQGIVDAAKFFAENKSPFEEGNYPSEKWGKGVGAALGAFAPVFKAMNEDRGWFESGDEVLQGMLNGIKFTTSALITSARMFFKAGNIWGAYPSQDWANGVKSTITSFMDIFQTIEDRGYSVISFRIYTGILSGALNSISTSARTLWLSQKYFSFKMDPGYIANLAKNVLGYGALSRMLDSILTVEEKKTISLGMFGDVTYKTKKSVEVSNINKVISQMVISAGILHKNRLLFGFKIDPNYMKAIASNVLTFADLATKLAQKQKGQSTLDEMLGLDPISRAAKGMVKIANAYDALAKAVKNFSGAINSLNIGKLHEFRVLTGNLAMLSALDSSMFSNMLKVLESRSGVFANMLQAQTSEMFKRPTVKAPGSGAAVQSKKDGEHPHLKDSRGETQLQKLDKIYQVLVVLKNEASGINSFLHTGKDSNEDMGSKGDG
jgi:hypothetical protein